MIAMRDAEKLTGKQAIRAMLDGEKITRPSFQKTRKVRKCPHCGGVKGFMVDVSLGGHHEFSISFKGKLLDDKREGTDDMPNSGQCLNCGKSIEIEKLDTQGI